MYLESLDYEKVLKDNKVEIVVGLDKGKNKVRAVMKVLIRRIDGKVLKTHVLKIEHIDSECDSYETIKKTCK